MLIVCALLTLGVTAQDTKKNKKKDQVAQAPAAMSALPKLSNAKDSASYAYGITLGGSLKRQLGTVDYNYDLLMDAMKAMLKGDSVLFSNEQAASLANTYTKKEQMKIHEPTIKVGEEFLKKNGMRPEVKTTASGLQYEVLKAGDANGKSPKDIDRVKVHYTGTLLDGTVFDSSVERGQPAEFGLRQVIKGWTEGLQLMKPGDKFKFFIPSALAYGDRQQGQKIKPYSTLIFEVELLEVLGPK